MRRRTACTTHVQRQNTRDREREREYTQRGQFERHVSTLNVKPLHSTGPPTTNTTTHQQQHNTTQRDRKHTR